MFIISLNKLDKIYFNNLDLWLDKNPLKFNQASNLRYLELNNLNINFFSEINQTILYENLDELNINNFSVSKNNLTQPQNQYFELENTSFIVFKNIS